MSRKCLAVELIEIPRERLAQVLELAKAALDSEAYGVIETVFRAYLSISELLEKKTATIEQLRKLLFGPKTERLRNIFSGVEEGGGAEEPSSAGSPGGSDGAAASGALERPKGAGEEKRARKGHGRNGASEYTGAERITISHPTLKPGDPCPDPHCKGKVYAYQPLTLLRVVGTAPLGAKVIEIHQLRCNLCLTLYRAADPEGFGTKKYDETAAAMLAVLRYGSGVPMYRIEGLQENLGVPLPDATQWDILAGLAKLARPAFEELIVQAAQGDVLHSDDTGVKILELMARRKERKADDG